VHSACAIVPALDAADTIGPVVAGLRTTLGVPVLVVDDGSRDGTAGVAARHGASVIVHERNLGKGQALRTGLRRAAHDGHTVALTVDADGQHPAASAAVVLSASDDPGALVLGVRDLSGDGAPRSNRFGNSVSNFFLSAFARRPLADTQCGLRRYPVAAALALGTRAHGFAFEAEIVLRAVAADVPIVETPVRVIYPHASQRRSHFRRVADPARIVATVVSTVLELRMQRS
jgi:glycosyltransferase involved in cell wall biosynthesis